MKAALELVSGLRADIDVPDVIGASLPRLPASGRQLRRPFRRAWVEATNGSHAPSPPLDLKIRLLKGFGGSNPSVVRIPSLAVGERWVGHVDLSLDDEALARQNQPAEDTGQVSWNDGEWEWPVQVLTREEWSLLPDHRVTLAGWISPYSQRIMGLTHECFPAAEDSMSPDEVLRRIYEHLASEWRIVYRPPAPNANNAAQRIRQPEEVLEDPVGKKGEGTCVELALLIASALQRVGANPLLCLLRPDAAGPSQHAIVGVGRLGAATLAGQLALGAFGKGFTWVEATGVCAGKKRRLDWDAAAAQARSLAEGAVVDSLHAIDAGRCQREYGITPYAAGPVKGFHPPYRAAAAPFLVVVAAIELGCADYPPSILDQHTLHRDRLTGESGSSGLERLGRCAEKRFPGLSVELTQYDGGLRERLTATTARAIVASDAELGLAADLMLLRRADGQWCWRKPFESDGTGQEPPTDPVLSDGAPALLLSRKRG